MRISMAKLESWLTIIGDGIFILLTFATLLSSLKSVDFANNIWDHIEWMIFLKVIIAVPSYLVVWIAERKKVLICEGLDERDEALMQLAAAKTVASFDWVSLIPLLAFAGILGWKIHLLGEVDRLVKYQEMAPLLLLGFITIFLILNNLPELMKSILFLYYDKTDEGYYY